MNRKSLWVKGRYLVLFFALVALIVLPHALWAQGLYWVKRAGGSGFDSGTAVGVDNFGNSYVVGNYPNTAVFGAGEPNETVLTAAPPKIIDIFISKFDSAGNLVWAKRAGGTGTESADAIAVNSSGHSCVVGSFTGVATFGPGGINQTILSATGTSDGFIARYDSDGNLVWAKRAGGLLETGIGRVALDSAENCYVFGGFAGFATFGSVANQVTLTAAGSSSGFMAKYNSSGELVWVKVAGGSGGAITVDTNGNIYVVGSFRGTATFGAGEPNQITFNAMGGTFDSDVVLAKYDNNGILTWAKRAGGLGQDGATGIALDSVGNLNVVGNFGSGAVFGPNEINQTTLFGNEDVFVAKYDAGGNLLWAKRAGGFLSDQAGGVVADTMGNSYVTGTYRNEATFGAGEANQTILTAAGNGDMYVAKFDFAGTLVWAKSFGATDYEYGYGIAIDGSGTLYVAGAFGGATVFGSGETNQTKLASAGNSDVFVAKLSSVDSFKKAKADFDDDGKSDLTIYRDGTWSTVRSLDNGVTTIAHGGPSWTPVAADYDGDGIADRAVYFDGTWVILRSSDSLTVVDSVGPAGSTPVPGDYDGDGKVDLAVYTNGVWSMRGSFNNSNTTFPYPLGGADWIPVPADYNGDGKADAAVYRDGTWSVHFTDLAIGIIAGHGGPGWFPVPGDYDGDGKADVAVYKDGAWSIRRSSNSLITVSGHGGPGLVPVPADYDGDGKTDIAVYHPAGAWSILQSSTNTIRVVAHGGDPSDVPLN